MPRASWKDIETDLKYWEETGEWPGRMKPAWIEHLYRKAGLQDAPDVMKRNVIKELALREIIEQLKFELDHFLAIRGIV